MRKIHAPLSAAQSRVNRACVLAAAIEAGDASWALHRSPAARHAAFVAYALRWRAGTVAPGGEA